MHFVDRFASSQLSEVNPIRISFICISHQLMCVSNSLDQRNDRVNEKFSMVFAIYHIECHRNHKIRWFVAAVKMLAGGCDFGWFVVARIQLGNWKSAGGCCCCSCAGNRPCPAALGSSRATRRSRVHQNRCAPTCASPLLWPG